MSKEAARRSAHNQAKRRLEEGCSQVKKFRKFLSINNLQVLARNGREETTLWLVCVECAELHLLTESK
jgi:hypothetical protein